jgi:succinate-semialdehyde dehydrogenase/glutarate-semialdehyde dehydrogenase
VSIHHMAIHSSEIVQKSRAAQTRWQKYSLPQRIQTVSQLTTAIEQARDACRQAIQQEAKKTREAADFEIDVAIRKINALCPYAEAALQSRILEGRSADSVISYEPLGVSVVITPWNFPFSITSALIAHSLIAGNSVIVKPSELTPDCGDLWQTICDQVLPEDVVQVVNGDGTLASQLVTDDTQLIVFVGGIKTGQAIMQNASKNFKRVILELGDKSSLFVLKEADLIKAAQFAARSCFNNAGQACISTERIIVEEEVFGPFLAHFKEQAETMYDKIPPLIHEQSALAIEKQIQDAVRQGAELVLGGTREAGFIPPTILTNVQDDMEVWQEENFGPVAAIKTSDDITTELQKINTSQYGLACTIFCEDLTRAKHIAEQINVGMVAINQGVHGHAQTPWVGMRSSGYGFHDSEDGYKQFAQIKVTHFPKNAL